MSAKCRDKFLIQSAIITPEKETIPIADFWVQQETQKDAIAEHKIRCVYLPPSSETVPEENEDLSNVSGMGTGAPSYASAGVPSGPGLGELGGGGAGASLMRDMSSRSAAFSACIRFSHASASSASASSARCCAMHRASVCDMCSRSYDARIESGGAAKPAVSHAPRTSLHLQDGAR